MTRTKDEALKLALDALGWTDEWRPQGLKERAITALRTAIAEAKKQEPVATVRTWHKNGDQHAELGDWELGLFKLPDGEHTLYTTPPAVPAPVQEPVGEMQNSCLIENGLALALHDAVLIRIGKDDEATRQAIARIDKLFAKYTSDAKLKEKNT
jgi:hypothetical protein